MSRRGIAFITVFCLVIGLSCQNTTVFHRTNFDRGELHTVAVIPFENETESSEAGRIISNFFSTELQASTKLEIMPEHKIMKIIGADLAKTDSPRNYRRLGKKLGAKTLVTGTISEYRYRRSLGEAPVVGFTIRFIDAKSGEILWGASASEERLGVLTYRGSLSEVSQRLSRHLVSEFNKVF